MMARSGRESRHKDHSSGKDSSYVCPMHPEVEQEGPGDCPKCGMALEPKSPTIAASKVRYTCPMHPEIVRDQPGNCPKCGMALEPMTVTEEEEDDGELRDMTTRFMVGVALGVPVLLLAMGPFLGLPIERLVSARWTHWLELMLATPVVLWCGWPFFERVWPPRPPASSAKTVPKRIFPWRTSKSGTDFVCAREREVAFEDPADFESVTGKGVRGRVGSREVALGNQPLLDELSIDPGGLAGGAEKLRGDGRTVMFLAVDGRLAGLLGVADPIKESTPEAVKLLHDEGIEIIMLTGDNRTTAEAVARKLGIDQVEAEVLPDQKNAVIRKLQEEGKVVAMAGDGINDAPALAQAHVGIAMGSGTDVAMESAGVTLVRGDLRGIAKARRLSRATMGNIRQNLFFAFIYNALGVPVAAGALFPFLGILLSPMFAAAAMSFSSVSVVGNALRLRGVQL